MESKRFFFRGSYVTHSKKYGIHIEFLGDGSVKKCKTQQKQSEIVKGATPKQQITRANHSDLSRGHLKMWFSKGISPPNPFNLGQGIIVILFCPPKQHILNVSRQKISKDQAAWPVREFLHLSFSLMESDFQSQLLNLLFPPIPVPF